MSAMDVEFYFRVLLVALQLSGFHAVYFAQENPIFCLPIPSRVGTIVGRVFAYPNLHDECTRSSLRFHTPSTAPDGPFTVTANGSIVLNVGSSTVDTQIGIQLGVTASCESEDRTIHSVETTVTIHPTFITDTGSTDLGESAIKHACFAGMPSTVTVEENTDHVVLGRLHGCSGFDGYSRKYIIKPKDLTSIDPIHSEITLLKPLDRERLGTRNVHGDIIQVTGVQEVQVTCDLTKGTSKIGTSRASFNISVGNTNDSLPFFQSNKMQRLVTDEKAIDGQEMSVSEVLEDNDPWNDGLYTVNVVKDPLRVCQTTNLLCYGQQQNKNICQLKVTIQNTDSLSQSPYKCEIDVIDDTFSQPLGSEIDNKVTLTINIHKADYGAQSRITKQFYRNATRLARLLEMRDEFSSTHANNGSYSLLHDIFKVTNRTGIVYVDNVDRLTTSSDLIALEVMTPIGVVVNITVTMVGKARQVRDEEMCADMCASHMTTKSCTGSCGLGLTSGGCVMRGNEYSTLRTNYGTCTYNTEFCPDKICDELERMFPLLCPQDCITKKTGPVKLNSKTGRGIVMAPSPCWCESESYRDDVEVTCHCYPMAPLVKQGKPSPSKKIRATVPPLKPPTKSATTLEEKTTTTKPISQPSTGNPDVSYALLNTVNDEAMWNTSFNNLSHRVDQGLLVATETSKVTCDNACATAIGLGLGAFIAICFSLFMLWFTKRRNDRRKSNMKHVGSVVSMSVVPSEYIDDRERRSSYSSPQWSPKGPIYMTQSMVIENENQKWEFPRDNLTLDKTLGEGEFGVVVKGLAIGIDGENSVKEVAVKMLKHCSTQMEELDLLSEFNLLKDVSHPNVIRLLGACTHDGPFYVIVEYCEHGCLLKYLRRSRLEESGYVNTHRRFKSPNAKEQTDTSLDGDLLSIRDLLSFAWQIAKGMSYLSEIKLVHRDLAARNVLVSKDRVLKISDFGLTRDVYEADTYMKKSKGRIPVKWLAPESLYAQIYTTRSDIWSYGIVLWEIVTLGAPPYPGIPPERLYNLLLGGYRMDKPENCPDEMFAVMQKCWKIDASDRPSFASLAEIFDRILQEKTGYLDLNGQDLYSKCFDSSMQDTIQQTSNVKPVRDTNSQCHEDTIDRMNITTVCNDSYLTPLNLRDTDKDKLTPLLGNHLSKNRDGHRQASGRRSGRSRNKTGSAIRNNSIDDKTGTKNMKNKHMIYPCENVSLLVDHNSAKFTNAFNNGAPETDIVQVELVV